MKPVVHNTPEDMQRILAKLPPLPRLQLEHSPGWRFERYPNTSPDHDDIVVFDSTIDAFNLSFSSDVFADTAEYSNSLYSGNNEMFGDCTPDELADLANQTDRLQQWLDDLAEVVAWTQAHTTEIIRQCS